MRPGQVFELFYSHWSKKQKVGPSRECPKITFLYRWFSISWWINKFLTEHPEIQVSALVTQFLSCLANCKICHEESYCCVLFCQLQTLYQKKRMKTTFHKLQCLLTNYFDLQRCIQKSDSIIIQSFDALGFFESFSHAWAKKFKRKYWVAQQTVNYRLAALPFYKMYR